MTYEINWSEKETEERMEWYGQFLHDGDFERYMPNIDVLQGSVKWVREAYHACNEAIRSLWILNRLTKKHSITWFFNQHEATKYVKMRDAYKSILDQIRDMEFDCEMAIGDYVIINEIPGIKIPDLSIEI